MKTLAARQFSHRILQCYRGAKSIQGWRTFLSEAYRCQEVWDARTSLPAFENINMEKFYMALDKKFQTKGRILPIDADMFAAGSSSEQHLEDLQDVVHRFRRSPMAAAVLPSTSHAVVRAFMASRAPGRRQRLLEILDDRINFGVFLDAYTANILMDDFLKEGNHRDAAKVASQLMMQEDWAAPLSRRLALLACHQYVLQPQPQPWRPPEPIEDEDAETEYVRVKYLTNEWHDGHFDLREPAELVGKTLAWLGGGADGGGGAGGGSCRLLGWALYGQWQRLTDCCARLHSDAEPVCQDVVSRVSEVVSAAGDQCPDAAAICSRLSQLPAAAAPLADTLRESAAAAAADHQPADIAALQQLYTDWHQRRQLELQRQQQDEERQCRIAALEERRQQLRERQRLLWFFDNEEQLVAEGGRHWDKPAPWKPARVMKLLRRRRPSSEEYVPPTVRRRHAK